jgi:hypothetical protein
MSSLPGVGGWLSEDVTRVKASEVTFGKVYPNDNAATPSMSFGEEYVGRHLIITVANNSYNTIGSLTVPSGITVGGVAATLLGSSTGTRTTASIWLVQLDEGTEGVVSLTGVGTRHAALSVTVYNVKGLGDPTPYDVQTSNAAPLAATLKIKNNGVAFGIASSRTYNVPFTWTGLALDNNFPLYQGSGGIYCGEGSSASLPTFGLELPITADQVGLLEQSAVFVSF